MGKYKLSKILNCIIITAISLVVFCGCGRGSNSLSDEVPNPDADHGEVLFSVIYTGDVHGSIYDKSDEGVIKQNYADVVALRDKYISENRSVFLVDNGDFVQGSAYGAIDKGASIIQIMNAAGYDAATVGSYEFDYGIDRTFSIKNECSFPLVSANFKNIKEDSLVFEPYTVVKKDGVSVAFIGVTTPDNYNKCSPANFMDENLESYIYGFCSDDTDSFFEEIQVQIDKARKEADYVVALAPLGREEGYYPYTSDNLIANTTGLDALIDGHSHDVTECEYVKNKDGNNVLMTQAGAYFDNIGEIDFYEDGAVISKLHSGLDDKEASIDGMIKELASQVEERFAISIAYADNNLVINDSDSGERLIRKQETNLGDLVADSIYYHFNGVEGIDCDVVLHNSGNIREDILAGDISYNSVKKTLPFGNIVCLVEVTGQDILDALEWGVRMIGEVDESGNDVENASFLQVAGIKFDVDTSVKSSVQTNENNVWCGSPTDGYKVSNVFVYNRETSEYEELVLEDFYKVGGVNYILTHTGDGFAMFKDSNVLKDFDGEEYMLLAEYIQLFAVDDDAMSHIGTKFAPLHLYPNYLLNYEDASGSGRINFINK